MKDITFHSHNHQAIANRIWGNLDFIRETYGVKASKDIMLEWLRDEDGWYADLRPDLDNKEISKWERVDLNMAREMNT